MNVGCRVCAHHTRQKVRASTTPYVSSGTGRRSVNQEGRGYQATPSRFGFQFADQIGVHLFGGRTGLVGRLERVAFDQIEVFTCAPEAAIALANAFGVQG